VSGRGLPLRIARLATATALAAAGVAYAWLWTTHSLRGYDVLSDRLGLADNALAGRVVELGFDIEYDPVARGVRVTAVRKATPAEAAGLRAGDLVVSADGRSVRESAAALGEVYLDRRPGDPVDLAVLRAGSEAPVMHRAVFRGRSLPTSLPTLVRILLGTTVLFPFVLLAVALPVLFYRLEDRNAWLLALLFLCLTAAPGFPNGFASLDGGWRSFATVYRAVLGGLLGASFYWLFAAFPTRSPLERRAPWLKWALLVIGLVLGLSGLCDGGATVPAAIGGWIGDENARRLGFGYGYVAIVLGLASLLANAWRPQTRDARRKIQVVAWGTAVGVLPATTLELLKQLGWLIPDWLMALGFVSVFVFPLSFAYAVVRHRVLELPVLLRRSARYVLVRRGFGVLLVLLALAANAVFALSFTRLFEVDATLATSAGVGFGLALASISAPGIRRATGRIDRAFFREAYDARVVLEELAARIRTVSSQAELGELLEEQVRRALQPMWIVTYFGSPDGRLLATGTPAQLGALPRDAAGLGDLASEGRPREFTRDDGRPLVPALAPLAPDYVVPCVVHGEIVGLVVLGPRLSEEPYSGEDGRLLSTVAAQAAVALDNLGLAARMAERIEVERRAAHEAELARRVQVQLLPREGRRLSTIECEGRCIQARAVGGDYFDFLDGSDGRLGLVLADVSGKGFAAALLMASLQASLRTLSPRGEDLRERLRAVNRLLVESTEASRYATLFLAEYEDASGRMRFVNCGHNPPLLLRAGGTVERLQPTAMVIGLVEPWGCDVGEVVLHPGDLLVAYSDGISEATDEDDNEFGDERLLETVAAFRAGPLPELLDVAFDAVRRFGNGEQADDQTLLVARARSEVAS
jgi:sigma-B regulation protein RsbU (phosphoserine phosphatase)